MTAVKTRVIVATNVVAATTTGWSFQLHLNSLWWAITVILNCLEATQHQQSLVLTISPEALGIVPSARIIKTLRAASIPLAIWSCDRDSDVIRFVRTRGGSNQNVNTPKNATSTASASWMLRPR